MGKDFLIHYLNNLGIAANIPIAYFSNRKTIFDNTLYVLDETEDKYFFVENRLQKILDQLTTNDKLAYINIDSNLIMQGIITNKDHSDIIFIGPIASTITDMNRIDDYIFKTNLSPKASKSLMEHLITNSKYSSEQLRAILINLNLILNESIINENEIILTYEEEIDRKSIYEEDYNKKERTRDVPNKDEINDFNGKMKYALTSGDVFEMTKLLNGIGNVYQEVPMSSKLQDERILSTNAIIGIHESLLLAGINVNQFENLLNYYLLQINNATTISELRTINVNALIGFTKAVKKSKDVEIKNPTIKRVIQYIDQNITHKILAKDICETLHINEHYLFTKFKEEIGKTLTEYINEKKIQRAMYYLTYTDKSISDISEFLDFSSQSYFQSVFKKVTGVTPQKYRQSSELMM